ncbi:uncharacterized protein LOC133187141 [Saccostrea echinata]|uniref:uncharacterized protein LOC133187141 n=1 Tax=Saccostrea echinata TaxID=191078 RepID=UPI002A7F003A|nr:uncharacterized protein LOC133187141 [Saccostrea echinata]
MRWILWALFILLLPSVILAQSGNDVIDAGLEAGAEIAQAISEKNFTGTMEKLKTKTNPFLKMIGPLIKGVSSLLGLQIESTELKFMRNMLSKIENRFDQVDQRLEEIARKIDWNRVNIQFFTFEKKILAMKMELDKFFNASSDSEFSSISDTFLKMYECVYENSAQMLYRHIVSHESTFSSNILTEAMRANEYNRRDVQAFLLGLSKLVIVGAEIEIAYYSQKLPTYLDAHENKWITQINNMREAMEKLDIVIETNFMEVATEDAKKILAHSRGKSNVIVANEIFGKLMDKFYWRYWFVAVYGDIKEHHVWLCNETATSIFHFSGFNLLLASTPEDTTSLDITAAQSALRQAQTQKKGWWFAKKTMNAREVSDSVKIDKTCSKYSGLAVVRLTTNVATKFSKKDYLVKEQKNPYGLFLFR